VSCWSPKWAPALSLTGWWVVVGWGCSGVRVVGLGGLGGLGGLHRDSTRSSAYTSAVFSETRYTLNGDLRVAYRASREGPRDIVFVPNWFTNCEVFAELPSLQGWVEAMTSLGRLIFFDLPGTGASDPVTPGAPPTLEQWADSISRA
jgi:hypothetical protein